ncbi:MAG: ATP-binding protein [Leptolyngbya sp. SIO3F4]|nr:ATP-binding protein [Leptolyngbya sp. SIO3F4]
MLYSSGSRSVNLTYLILEALRMSPASIPYYVSQFLTDSFPEKVILEGDSHYFELRKYAEEGLCKVDVISRVDLPPGYAATARETTVHNHVMTLWDAKKLKLRYEQKNFCFEVQWQGHKLMVLQLSWPQGYFDDCRYYWILADTQAVADEFFAAVCEWNSQVREEVLVFEGGFWQKNRDLYASIQSATLDNLVLAGTLKEDIFKDAERFFESQAMYSEYNVPWKRGLLFIGPPGNGKTHMVKALVNSLGYPCLYIKSFKNRQNSDTDNMRLAFNRVREAAPCIVVIEDLDALVDDENRSFFLNELDGFALNDGVLMIASTNHPERLDIAILERPSRFDRKYHFDPPEMKDRVDYLQLWNQKLKPEMQLSINEIDEIANISDNFSYAYLKELLLSASMLWVQNRKPGTMASIMAEQLNKLKAQMQSQASKDNTDGQSLSHTNGKTSEDICIEQTKQEL